MTPASLPFGELLARVTMAAKLQDKLRLLVQSRTTVRRASRDERTRLALALGIDGADALVEQLGSRILFARALGAAVDRAKHDPRAMDVVLEALRSRKARRGLMSRALEKVEEVVEQTLMPESNDPPEPPPHRSRPAPDVGDVVHVEIGELKPSDNPFPRGDPKTRTSPPEPASAVPEPAPEQSSRAKAEPVAEARGVEPRPRPIPAAARIDRGSRAVSPAVPDVPATSPPPPEMPTEGQPVPRPTPRRVPGDLPGAASKSVRAREPAHEAVDPPALTNGVPESPITAHDLIEAVRAESMLVRRMRVVREQLDRVSSWAMPQVDDLLGEFATPWVRRRVLQMLFERRVPASIDEAQALIETLERPSAQLWSYATLLDSYRPDPEKQEALLARIDSDFVRRCLTRRLHRP